MATRPDRDGVDRAPSNRDDVPSDPCRDRSQHRPRSSGARYRRRSPRSELPRLVARYVGRRGSSSRTGFATECRARNISHRHWSTSADRHIWRLLVMRRRRSIPAGDGVVAGSSGGRRLGQSRRISKRPSSCVARPAMSPGSEVRISTGPPNFFCGPLQFGAARTETVPLHVTLRYGYRPWFVRSDSCAGASGAASRGGVAPSPNLGARCASAPVRRGGSPAECAGCVLADGAGRPRLHRRALG